MVNDGCIWHVDVRRLSRVYALLSLAIEYARANNNEILIQCRVRDVRRPHSHIYLCICVHLQLKYHYMCVYYIYSVHQSIYLSIYPRQWIE